MVSIEKSELLARSMISWLGCGAASGAGTGSGVGVDAGVGVIGSPGRITLVLFTPSLASSGLSGIVLAGVALVVDWGLGWAVMIG